MHATLLCLANHKSLVEQLKEMSTVFNYRLVVGIVRGGGLTGLYGGSVGGGPSPWPLSAAASLMTKQEVFVVLSRRKSDVLLLLSTSGEIVSWIEGDCPYHEEKAFRLNPVVHTEQGSH